MGVMSGGMQLEAIEARRVINLPAVHMSRAYSPCPAGAGRRLVMSRGLFPPLVSV